MNTPTAYLAIPNVIICSEQLIIPVANPTTSPRMIQKGEVLGMVQRTSDSMDKCTSG